MIFTTPWFLIFATICIGTVWLAPSKLRLWILGAACIYFHAHFAGPAGVIPIVILMVVTYAAALTRSSVVCICTMATCVVALCFYKYVGFLIASSVQPWNPNLAEALAAGTKRLMPAAPPLAVSFFTFEFVHYLFDVRKGGEPIRNPLKFLLFAIFFPSLVAGPIKRYQQFIPELDSVERQRVGVEDVAEGLRRIALGFAKKVLIADTLTFYIDQTHPTVGQLGLWSRWLFVVSLGLRILFDFSGYSDIAIGVARLLGIRLPENFDWPYLAGSLRDFWQRWHISLSSWIRDYVYVPLGGSRHGLARRALNGIIAFALCGLWHGPAWNFVLWGLLHGAGLALCNTYAKIPGIGPGLQKVFQREPAVGWVLTQAFVMLSWLLFFYPADEALRLGKLVLGIA